MGTGEYEVEWRTYTMAGGTYRGRERVFAADYDEAKDKARRQVHRRVFPDLSPGDIKLLDAVRVG